jgi:hypothetical protein
VAPGARDLAGRDQPTGQAAEADLPLVAPDLEVDVDDVVVGGRDAAEPVVELEGPLLGEGAVVPDDPQSPVRLGRPVAVGWAGRAELGRGARCVDAAALGDDDVLDPLTLAERDLAEGAAEVAVVAEGDPLVDDERAVRRDLDDDVGGRERERLRLRAPGRREGGEKREG